MFLQHGLKMYQQLIYKRPYTVQTLQTVTLMCVGDILSQYIATNAVNNQDANQNLQLDPYRTLKFGSIGFVLGPMLLKWYQLLDKINAGPKKVIMIKRVLCDQLFFAPFAILFMTTMISVIDGKTTQDLQAKLQKDFFHMLFTNYKIWPLVQSINFTLVPLNYRLLVTQTVAVGWNAYMSWKLNSKI